jgi:hypothetical protein
LYDMLVGVSLIAAFPVLMTLVIRALAPPRAEMADLFKSPTELGWPRGVQEEDLLPWRIELLEGKTGRDARTAGVDARDTLPGRRFDAIGAPMGRHARRRPATDRSRASRPTV